MITDAQAKAVEQVAKTAGLTLDTGQKLGAFLGRVFGTVPDDAVGILGGDWLHHVRLRNAARLALRTEEILSKKVGINTTQVVSPSVALPLLRAAQDESRDEVSELWANLLANAMDFEKSRFVERWVITTLQTLEPVDALVLQTINKRCKNMTERIGILPSVFIECFNGNFSDDSILLSVTRLTNEFSLLASSLILKNQGNMYCGDFRLPNDGERFDEFEYGFQYTAKGRQFIRACLPMN